MTEETKADTDGKDPPFITWKIAVWIVGTIVLIMVLWLEIGHRPWTDVNSPKLSNAEQAGQFGDSFGYINSLFSGLALAGVAIAIVLQSLELREQRIELKLTKQEMAKSVKAQDQAQKALNKQSELMFLSAFLNAAESVRYDAITATEPQSGSTKYERLHQQINLHRCRIILDRSIRDLEKYVVNSVTGWKAIDVTTRVGAIDELLRTCQKIFQWSNYLTEQNTSINFTTITDGVLTAFMEQRGFMRSDFVDMLNQTKDIFSSPEVYGPVSEVFEQMIKPKLEQAIETL